MDPIVLLVAAAVGYFLITKRDEQQRQQQQQQPYGYGPPPGYGYPPPQPAPAPKRALQQALPHVYRGQPAIPPVSEADVPPAGPSGVEQFATAVNRYGTYFFPPAMVATAASRAVTSALGPSHGTGWAYDVQGRPVFVGRR